jgi:hypothetical protein
MGPERVAGRRLDFYDIGAEIGENRSRQPASRMSPASRRRFCDNSEIQQPLRRLASQSSRRVYIKPTQLSNFPDKKPG